MFDLQYKISRHERHARKYHGLYLTSIIKKFTFMKHVESKALGGVHDTLPYRRM